VLELALDRTDLSPRELACRFATLNRCRRCPGRSIRTSLNFLAISIPTQVVWDVVQGIEVMAGPPEWGLDYTLRSYESVTSRGFLVMYYGSEFVAKKVQEWLEKRAIGALFIEPGSPWQNGHNESFNGVSATAV